MAIVLKKLLAECRITSATLARAIENTRGVGYSKATISMLLKHGTIPTTDPKFTAKVKRFLEPIPCVQDWLADRKLKFNDVWRDADDSGGVDIEELAQEVVMLSAKARTHFKIFKDPFSQEISSPADIFLSKEHRFMYYAMKDAALERGFVGVVGEVGSGKSTARKWLEREVETEPDVKLIMPQALDKSSLTAPSLLDSIVYDLSDRAPKSGPEAKARQVTDLLVQRSRDGVRVALIMEEAQDLTPKAFKMLKRLYEVEDGFKKTLGIVLIGQTELGHKLDERENPSMREVIRRCHTLHIEGLNGSTGPYIDFKCKRANIDRKKLFTDGALEALGVRLTRRRSGRDVSNAQPLTVNNLCILALNMAAEIGEKVVTDEVINKL